MFHLKEINTQKEFDKEINLTNNFKPGEFLQSFKWGQFEKKIGNQSKQIHIYKNDEIVGKANIIFKEIKLKFNYAYCPYGPILRKDLKQKEIELIFDLLIKFCQKYKLYFIRFNLPVDKMDDFEIPNLKLSKAKSKQPEKTIVINLKQTQKKILANMKSKTRYNIRLSQKKELKIRKGVNKKLISDFLKLTQITSERDKFKPHSNEYYKNLIEIFKKNKNLKIYTVYHKDKAVASNMVIFFNGVATYLHGASSNKNRNLMPTYLLQWKSIIDAKRESFKYYDFWGIDDKKWPGVTKFKEGFQGQIEEFHPTYELPVNKYKYLFYSFTRFFV